jgi:hypothetical protein
VAALTASALNHQVLQNRAPIVGRHRPGGAKKIQNEEQGEQQKKTSYLEGGRKPSRRRPYFHFG